MGWFLVNKAKRQMKTIHIPDAHKPPRERCSGVVPQCSINHYVQVPLMDTRGTWQFEHMAHVSGKN